MKFVADMQDFAQVDPQEGIYYLGKNDGEDGFVILMWSKVFGWMTSEGEPGVTDKIGVVTPAEKH